MGTRPEIIKLAPLISKIPKRNSTIIFSGQHFDYDMGLKFIDELGTRKPDYTFKLGKKIPSLQISQIISKLSKVFDETKPENVIVQGDTNTVLASSIAALKFKIPISHVESGLRSFDWRMPEEHNRITTDHISELLFAPTYNAKKNLLSENVHGQIFVTGNTVIDSIQKFSKLSKKKSTISIPKDEYVLLTLHRSENVDNKETLTSIINAIITSKKLTVFLIHPRTLQRLRDFNLYSRVLKSNNIIVKNAVGYFDMLELMKHCLFIVTDSGGIQEEATSPIIQKKVLVVRKTTDRPEAVQSGVAQLIGTSQNKLLKSITETTKNPKLCKQTTPYGKGKSSEKIASIMNQFL